MADRFFALNADRACLLLTGEDARAFLQGMVSNDVDRLTTGHAVYAGFLTAQGRFLHDLFIVALPNGAIILDCESNRLDDLKRRLTMYKLRAKVIITDARETFSVVLLWGQDAPDALGLPLEPGAVAALNGGVVFVDPRLVQLGCRAIVPRVAAADALKLAGFAPAPLEDHQRIRLSLGVPEGSRDMPVEKALPLESGFEELNGVDFKKGCYVGQELTARMKFRALVKKRLFPVEIEGPVPSPGTLVMQGDEEAGELRSVLDGIGLALLKLDAVEAALSHGTSLVAAGAIVRPKKPAWFGRTSNAQ